MTLQLRTTRLLLCPVEEGDLGALLAIGVVAFRRRTLEEFPVAVSASPAAQEV